jgi:hypothetical protein
MADEQILPVALRSEGYELLPEIDKNRGIVEQAEIWQRIYNGLFPTADDYKKYNWVCEGACNERRVNTRLVPWVEGNVGNGNEICRKPCLIV